MEASDDDRVRKIAELLIVRYGERAASHATLQALKARQGRESEYREVWESVAAAVARSLRTEPKVSE